MRSCTLERRFSGGVDSFSTFRSFLIQMILITKLILYFFHVGQYGDVKNPRTWEKS